MQQRMSSCWQCGTVLSAAGGRCPACGAEQLTPAAERAARAQLSSEPDGEPEHASSVPLWILLFVGLGVIGAGALFLRPRAALPAAMTGAPLTTQSASASTKTAANDLSAVDLKAVDPMETMGRAKTVALGWSKDAVLVSIRARPVVSGHVNVQAGGSVEYWFGKPTGVDFGPGTTIAGKRLHISLESTGTKTEEIPGGAGRAALEPNCLLDEAARAAQAAGIVPPFVATYDVTDRLPQKPIWHVSTDGKETTERQIDGLSCAVLVR